MPRKRTPRVRICEWCGHLISPDRGPAAKTCSPECQRDRNCAREKARYQRVKHTPKWRTTRIEYLQRLRQRMQADPDLAARILDKRRAAVRRHRDKIAADPARYAAYLAGKRTHWHSRTPTQKAARKYWYGSLSPETKALFLLELRMKRERQRLREAMVDAGGNPPIQP